MSESFEDEAEGVHANAWKLFLEVAHAEQQQLHGKGTGQRPTRAWLLDTYGECLRAARGLRNADGEAGDGDDGDD